MSAKRSASGRAKRPASTRRRPTRSTPPRWRRRFRWLAGALLAGAVGFGVATLLPGPLRPSADAAVAGVAQVQIRIGAYDDHGGGVEVAPVDGGADVLLVLYPGGLVRPHAYTWIGVALAPVGIRTLIPAMPLDLAVLARDRATRLIDGKRQGERLVVAAGHSLGGAMAASWVVRNPERVDGLVLMGAYPSRGDDLSGLALPTLVLAAEYDGLASLEEIQAGLARLPSRAGIEIVDGAVHAFFGRYGLQRGDGLPTVSRAVAEAEIAGAVEAFLAGIR